MADTLRAVTGMGVHARSGAKVARSRRSRVAGVTPRRVARVTPRWLAPVLILAWWVWIPAVTGCFQGDREARRLKAESTAQGVDANSVGVVADAAATATTAVAQDSGSAEAAVAVVRDYYAAIDAGDYGRAYRYWASGGEASGQTFEEFRRGLAGTASVRVEVGEPGRIEGAAGSRYIRIPVEVHATTTQGAAQCFRGSYTLRRAVVPGATEEQRRWRIYSAELRAC
jgi:hypothetical protein